MSAVLISQCSTLPDVGPATTFVGVAEFRAPRMQLPPRACAEIARSGDGRLHRSSGRLRRLDFGPRQTSIVSIGRCANNFRPPAVFHGYVFTQAEIFVHL